MVSPLQQRLQAKQAETAQVDNPMAAGAESTPAAAPAGRKPRAPRHTPIERHPVRETAPVQQGRHRLRPIEDYFAIEGLQDDDPLHIPRQLIPEGFDLQWVADTVYGASDPRHRASFERKGWVSIMQDEFDGRFDGIWMKAGQQGEINNGGLVLMARPKVFTKKARYNGWMEAQGLMRTQEQKLASGDLAGVTLDPRHKTATGFNYIKREVERLPTAGRISEPYTPSELAGGQTFDIPSAVRKPAQPQPWE